MHSQQTRTMPLGVRAAIGALVFLLLLFAGLKTAHATEIIPSIGMSHGSGSDANQMFLAVGLRTGFLPRTKAELNVGYRSEDYMNGLFQLRTIPVTASVWLSPVPTLYVGGGGGAYFQTISYDNSVVVPSSSETQWGAHLGGGLRFPIAPMLGLDFGGRYVFLQEKTSSLSAGTIDPSFWSATAGLSIGF